MTYKILYIFILLLVLPPLTPAQEGLPKKLNTLELTGDTTQIARALDSVADRLDSIPFTEALYVLDSIIKECISAQYIRGAVYSHLYKAKVYYDQEQNVSFIRTLERAIAYCSTTEEGHKFLSLLYNETGWAYVQSDNYERATAYLYRAHALAIHSANHKLNASISLNLAAVMLMLNQYNQAATYLDEAEQEFSRQNMPYNQARALLYRSLQVLKSKNDTLASIGYLERAIDIARKNDIKEFLLMALDNKARLYLEMQRYIEAQDLLQEAIRLQYNHNAPVRIGILVTLGETRTRLGDYQQALSLLQEAQTLIASSPYNSENMINIYRAFSDLYKATGNYEQALRYKDLYVNLKDSVASQQIKESINHFEIQYRSVKKDKRLAENNLMIALQQTDIADKKRWLYGISIAAFVLITVVILVYKQKQRNVEYKLRTLQQQEEIMAWQATIKGEEKERARVAHELHDGIGGQLFTLNMYLDTLGKDFPQAGNSTGYRESMLLLKETMKDLRNTAHNMMPELLVDNGLTEAIHRYCDKITQTRHMRIDFQQYGTIPVKDNNFELSVYHIIRELIQNILKHAHASRALVQFSCHDDLLNITVEDNGTGLQRSPGWEDGMGMKTIVSRVKSMRGNCSIQTSEAGTVVYLEFDLSRIKQTGT